MGLLAIAVFGLVVPNGLFLYWLAREFSGFGAVLADKLAVAFILDAFLALAVMAYLFAKDRTLRYPWYWFVGLSIVGGLGFSIPFYHWLNRRAAPQAG